MLLRYFGFLLLKSFNMYSSQLKFKHSLYFNLFGTFKLIYLLFYIFISNGGIG